MHAGPHISAMQWIAATVGLFQGLGISYAVNCLISVFRLRKVAKFDWIPLVWMIVCFILMLQFWWALLELSALVTVWTLPAFLVVISIPLSLYIAVALFLPTPSSQYAPVWADEFWRDGKWGMLALSYYALAGWAANIVLFKDTSFGLAEMALVAEFILAIAFLIVPQRRARVAITILYAIIIVINSIPATPYSYG